MHPLDWKERHSHLHREGVYLHVEKRDTPICIECVCFLYTERRHHLSSWSRSHSSRKKRNNLLAIESIHHLYMKKKHSFDMKRRKRNSSRYIYIYIRCDLMDYPPQWYGLPAWSAPPPIVWSGILSSASQKNKVFLWFLMISLGFWQVLKIGDRSHKLLYTSNIWIHTWSSRKTHCLT